MSVQLTYGQCWCRQTHFHAPIKLLYQMTTYARFHILVTRFVIVQLLNSDKLISFLLIASNYHSLCN